MKRKLLLVLLTVAMAIACAFGFAGCNIFDFNTDGSGGGQIPPWGNEGEPGPGPSTAGLEYELSDDGTAYTVVGITDIEITNIVIPATYKGLPVTSIGSGAFSGCRSLTSVTIPDSVTSIGSWAFSGCSELTNITIPDSVTSIGSWAFEVCNRLTSITIPDSVTCIGEGAFEDCDSLTSITLPFVGAQKDGTEDTHFGYIFGAGSYGSNGSYVPASLKTVVITGGTCIDESAFEGCSSLTSVTIPDSVTGIGDSAFRDCSGLTSVTIPAGVTSIGWSAFSGCSSLTSVTIPAGVTSIGEYAFNGCSGLTSVTIPAGVTSIGSGAFSGCSSLTSVTIPNSVTSIGEYAFYGCGGLTEVRITDLAAWCAIEFDDIDANPLYYAHNLYLNGELISELVIPDSVTSIGQYAFYNCSALTSIAIPDSVTSIGRNAFYGCSGLKEVHITDLAAWCAIEFNNSYTNPVYYAHNLYLNGELIIDLVIPDGVTSIGSSAFYNCSNLTSIIIPDSVTSIGSSAFEDCDSLVSITLPFVGAQKDGTKNTHFGYIFGTVPASLKTVIITGGTSIGDYAFYNCSSLTSITIGDSVTSIGQNAFYGCSGLESINVENGNSQYHSQGNCLIETASKTLILGCKNSIIPTDGSVTSIGEDAFHDCSGLTSITIPDSVTSIGSSAFSSCSSLTSITIPDGVTSIGDRAFYGCSGLTSITIGDGVTSIEYDAFYGCYNLIEVYNLSNLSLRVGSNDDGYVAFYAKHIYTQEGDSWLTDTQDGYRFLYDGETGYLLGYYGTETALTLPRSFTAYDGTQVDRYEIYKYAFYNCSSLTSITIPDGVTSIGEFAFWNCSSLTSITIPDGVTSIGDRAFYHCSSLTSITIPDSVTSIGYYAFDDCDSLSKVYYGGTAEDWADISIGSYNSALTSATRYYYSETPPTDEGNYWHYVDGKIVEW